MAIIQYEWQLYNARYECNYTMLDMNDNYDRYECQL